MRVLVVGGGGREHALVRTFAASPLVTALFCAPGNAGIANDAELVDMAADDVAGLVAWARTNAVDLVVPGPEAALVAGVVDAMEGAGIACIGPNAAAARLEASKSLMKEIADAAGVPTASWRRFEDAGEARAWIAVCGAPVVIKADGLTGGKGVTVAFTEAEALRAVDEALAERVFGDAGSSVVIEEFLDGEEASYHVLVDGTSILPLATAQDHKRVGDGDTGPNTGGMGCYSPAPVVTPEIEARILDDIIRPTIAAMSRLGTPFRGVLYAGLMITSEGPRLLEYNVRFGDPECQVLLARLEDDLVPALLATRDGTLDGVHLTWREESALTVVMATRGYPGTYPQATPIRRLDDAAGDDGVILHAGTAREGGGWVSAGGRVLGVTACGACLAEARDRAYRIVDRIDWADGFCRRDIGLRGLSHRG
ncbi:MAG: phosphoribosylamine--glycine ligase [bacterium]|nr:phosphoribosylamine--glycine ligase [bacterium]